MRMDMSFSQRMSQVQVMAPRMIQAMKVLQMPIMDLKEHLDQELLENPVLEQREPNPADPDFEAPPADDVRDPGNKELVSDTNNELDFDRLDAMSRDYGDIFNEEHRPSRNGIDDDMDRKMDAMNAVVSRPQSLQDYLNDQIGFLDLPRDRVPLVRHVIAHIDDNGFLTVPDENDKEFREMLKNPAYKPERAIQRRQPSFVELAETFDLWETTPDDIEDALYQVQKLDPPGVGARDLKECLLLQVNNETPHRDLVRRMILDHLEDIPHNRLPLIERNTGADIPTVKEAIEVIRHLNPRPGAGFLSENIPYVVPDILVERNEEGEYTIKLLDDWLPEVYISKRYVDLYKDRAGDPKMREYLKRKIQAAQWLQESIEQRRSTLQKVTRAIIDHQRPFLEKGPEYIKPLKMQEVADQVGVHVTTVSRAVDDKWVQTPRGIFPLKRFFGGGMKVGGEDVAWEVMKSKLLEIIDAENKAEPLSDEDLVDRMNAAGCPVKRRTITKYRQLAGIPSSRERKDWAAASKG